MAVNFDAEPRSWIDLTSLSSDIQSIIHKLTADGTLQFHPNEQGLFPAATGDAGVLATTGYRNVWTRDTVNVAYALWQARHSKSAIHACQALIRFYGTQEPKLDHAIAGEADSNDMAQRPAIRFDGDTLTETDPTWAHSQNDALGYFLWLFAQLVRQKAFEPTQTEWRIVGKVAHFLLSLPYWKDADSGHWEECRHLSAASIGVATAGLEAYAELLNSRIGESSPFILDSAFLKDGVAHARAVLAEILPAECIQEDPRQYRRYDSALLFLIQPTGLLCGDGDLGEAMARQIVEDVTNNLLGDYGIKRYLGDSYWSKDYRLRLSLDQRAINVSDDTSERDAGFVEGTEAQWCIFDPILSVIYGRWWRAEGREEDRKKQIHHLQRALDQLYWDSSRGIYLCPEAYALESDQWGPNDQTPLLWSQANLLLALHEAQINAEKDPD